MPNLRRPAAGKCSGLLGGGRVEERRYARVLADYVLGDMKELRDLGVSPCLRRGEHGALTGTPCGSIAIEKPKANLVWSRPSPDGNAKAIAGASPFVPATEVDREIYADVGVPGEAPDVTAASSPPRCPGGEATGGRPAGGLLPWEAVADSPPGESLAAPRRAISASRAAAPGWSAGGRWERFWKGTPARPRASISG